MTATYPCTVPFTIYRHHDPYDGFNAMDLHNTWQLALARMVG